MANTLIASQKTNFFYYVHTSDYYILSFLNPPELKRALQGEGLHW